MLTNFNRFVNGDVFAVHLRGAACTDFCGEYALEKCKFINEIR